MSSDSENFFAERDGFMSICFKMVDISDNVDEGIEFIENDDDNFSYRLLWDKIYYEIIHQIRFNKFIRGDYTNDKFCFWQTIYNYDYFKENKQYTGMFTGYKTYLYDFYGIKDNPTNRGK